MSDRANVRSVAALAQAKAALLEFVAIAQAARASVDGEVRHVTDYLRMDRPAYWKHEIRARESAVTQCKLEIQRKKLIAAPEPASTVFEERQLRKAQARLDSARERLAAVHRWQPVWEKEAAAAKSMMRGLDEALSNDIPRAVSKLERMMLALEAYAAVKTPGHAEPRDAPPEVAEAPKPEEAP
ncbi:MAG: hypothetical protein HBSAPP03_26520 [Phycisphaerae bacterium]|nr:MAG: hypothetical protein HBSAPP03_26520 [Phycisphaerae bacterium]